MLAEKWAAHDGTASIIGMPDSNGSFQTDSECRNGRLGNLETYLTVDVTRWVIRQLGGSSRRSQWAIGGPSSGGTCAMHLTLRHRAQLSTSLTFGAEGKISNSRRLSYLFARPPGTAAFLAVARYSPAELLASYRPNARMPVQGWVEAGRNDGAVSREAVVLCDTARRHGLPTELRLLGGGAHTFRVWRRSIADAYPWLMKHFADQNKGAASHSGPMRSGSDRGTGSMSSTAVR